MLVLGTPLINAHRKQIAAFAVKHRLPASERIRKLLKQAGSSATARAIALGSAAQLPMSTKY